MEAYLIPACMTGPSGSGGPFTGDHQGLPPVTTKGFQRDFVLLQVDVSYVAGRKKHLPGERNRMQKKSCMDLP